MADIYQWEWIDPTDTSKGTKPSTTPAPDGVGRDASPGADFRDLDLTKAYLSGVDLTSAYIYRTNLYRADLSGADLRDTNISYPNLTETNLEGALVTGMTLLVSDHLSLTLQQLTSTSSYQSGHMDLITLMGTMDLSGGDFSGKQMTGSHFEHTNFSHADFRGADLTDVEFENTILSGADFTGAEVSGAYFVGGSFTVEQLIGTKNYQMGDLSDMAFRDAGLSGINLNGFDLNPTWLVYSNLTGAELRGTDLRNASLEGSDLSGADLRGADLRGTRFDKASVYDADLRGANLSGAQIRISWFGRSDLSGADLSETNARSSSYIDAVLREVDLTNADMEQARLQGADLTGARIEGASFYDTTRFGFTFEQFQSTASYQEGKMRGLNLRENDLTGWDFSGLDLSGTGFTAAYNKPTNLTDANFTGAIILGADFSGATRSGLTFAQIQSTGSYQAKDLRGVKFDYVDMSGWDLSGQDLSEAHFRHTVLIGADLTSAVIRNALFMSYVGDGLNYEQLQSTASYKKRDLRGVQLERLDLSGADLSDQDLRGSRCTDCDLSGATLRGANLQRSDWDGTDLSGVDLSDADARGTRMSLTDDQTRRHFIYPNGNMEGLILGPGESWLWRDYTASTDGYRIRMQKPIHLASDSTVIVNLERNHWGSMIDPSGTVPVTLGGTLELNFVEALDPDELIGSEFKLFDWTGVQLEGEFDRILGSLGPGMSWDTSMLYTDGVISIVPEPAIGPLWLSGAMILARRLSRLEGLN